MLRGSADVAHLGALSEFVLPQEAVNVQFGELEGALIHAFLLHVEHICVVGDIQKLVLNLRHRERGELF